MRYTWKKQGVMLHKFGKPLTFELCNGDKDRL